jgi:hypothetical protein
MPLCYPIAQRTLTDAASRGAARAALTGPFAADSRRVRL